MTSAQRDINRKLRIFEHAKTSGNVSKTCRYFGISRTAFYDWKKAFQKEGEAGLVNQKPCPQNPKLRPVFDSHSYTKTRKRQYIGKIQTE